MTAPVTTIIVATHLVDTHGSAAPGWVSIHGGHIIDRGSEEPPSALTSTPGEHHLHHVHRLVPGLVDIHAHGAVGVDFGQLGQDPQPAISYHHATGTTTLLASLASAPHDALRDRIAELAPFVTTGDLAGLHLEGPWLSPERRGAHALNLLQGFDQRALDELLATAAGTIRMVTLAPELPGGLEAIRTLVGYGIIAAIGHTNADTDTVHRAIDAGASVITHLFNGMPPLHHREAGPVGVALTHQGLAVELIADGVHVQDEVIDLVVQSIPDRVVLISDAMAATGLGDGEHVLGGSRVVVREGIATVVDNGSLAGSTTALGGIVERLDRRGVPLGVLIRATTGTPSQALGLSVPALGVGDRADVRIQDAQGPWRTMRSGQWLDSSR
jgi:N-acetylglucosamine-6-phosphate deacetylase